jgi:thermostable 8-oxoguanine DNA glycosylase
MPQSIRRAYGRFVLQFPPSELLALADRYGYEQDNDALNAGRNIANSDYSIANLKKIIGWKSARIAGLIERNSASDVAKALRFATDKRTSEKWAIETLCGLKGVGIPVASAILTMVYPDKYTIIDFRALEALGIQRGDGEETVDFYLEYLQTCRSVAQEYKIDLRTLDRALWQWSKEHGSSDNCADK